MTKLQAPTLPETQLDNDAFVLRIARKAPALLKANGRQQTEDVVAQAWEQTKEAFSRLHGQRLLEVMKAMFDAIPKGERIWLEWEEDEQSYFYLRFSNEWSIGNQPIDPDKPNCSRWEHATDNVAPKWFPRDGHGIDAWDDWYNILHQSTIDPQVDALAQKRLMEAVGSGGVTLEDLPRIKLALLGPDWATALARVDINAATAAAPTPRAGKKNRL